MTLQEFVESESKRLEAFRVWWITNNKTEPSLFPMEFEEDNEGVWHEMLAGYEVEE